MQERSNAEWMDLLKSNSYERAIALGDLRKYLIKSLTTALQSWKRGVGGKFDALIEDAVQDTLVKILDNLDTFRSESRFTTWASKIAIRTALTELRRKRWRDVSLEKMAANAEAMFIDKRPSSDPEGSTMERDLKETMYRMMNEELTEKQRTAMVAVVFEGVPLDVVARRMETNRNALYKLLHDARKRLKAALAAAGMAPSEADKVRNKREDSSI